MEQRRGIVVFAVDDEPLEAIERRAVDRFQDCHEIDQPEAGPKHENLGARTRVDGDRAVKLIRSRPRMSAGASGVICARAARNHARLFDRRKSAGDRNGA